LFHAPCLDQWSKIKKIYRTFRIICRFIAACQTDNIFPSSLIRKISSSYHSRYRFRHEINVLQSRKSTVIELCNSLKKPRRNHKQRYKKKNLASAPLNFMERTLIRAEASKQKSFNISQRAWWIFMTDFKFVLSSFDTRPIFNSTLILLHAEYFLHD